MLRIAGQTAGTIGDTQGWQGSVVGCKKFDFFFLQIFSNYIVKARK